MNQVVISKNSKKNCYIQLEIFTSKIYTVFAVCSETKAVTYLYSVQ